MSWTLEFNQTVCVRNRIRFRIGRIPGWRECLDYADNADLQVATRDWLYMWLRRPDQPDAAAEVIAAIPPDIEVIEDEADLQRLR